MKQQDDLTLMDQMLKLLYSNPAFFYSLDKWKQTWAGM